MVGVGQRGHLRVTVDEAATLQTFPDDYPWAGGVSAKFQQVGNAYPPVVAAAMIRHLLT